MKRRYIVILILAAALVIGCAVFLLVCWPLAGRLAGLLPGHSTLAEFKKLVDAERYAEAYQMTTVRFRASITLKEFKEFCKRRDTTRTEPEILGPDRRKCPQSNLAMGVSNTNHLPFRICIERDDDGHWRIDEVIMHEFNTVEEGAEKASQRKW